MKMKFGHRLLLALYALLGLCAVENKADVGPREREIRAFCEGILKSI